MITIEVRRTLRMKRPMSAGSQALLVPRRKAGTTISLEIMMASATLATITMAVAAERPPMKAISVIAELPAARGSSSTKRSASTLVPERQQARRGDRHDENVDGDEIGGEEPGRPADLAGAVVLHHRDVELPRQQHAGDEGEECLRQPRAAGRVAIVLRGDLRHRGRLRIEVARPVEHHPGDEDADAEEGEQLHHRLHRHGQDHAVLVLGGVGMARAEQYGEERQREGDEQREVADDGEHDDVGDARHHGRRPMPISP